MSKSNFLRTIFTAPFWDQFFYWIVLLGILPGIFDYSLFFLEFRPYRPASFMLGSVMVVAFAAVPFYIIRAFRRKSFAPLLGLLPYFWFTIYAISEAIDSDWITNDTFEYLLSWTARISFVFFVFRGSTLGWYFWLFVLLLSFSGPFILVLLFVGFTLLSRLIFLVISDNLPLLSDLTLGQLINVNGRALKLWAPMLLVIIPSFMFTKHLEEQAIQGIYDHTFLQQESEERHFTEDLDYSLDTLFEELRLAYHAQLDQLKIDAGTTTKTLPGQLRQMIVSSIVPPEVKVNTQCKWYQFGCKVGRKVAQKAAGATRTAFVGTVEKFAAQVESGSADILGDANRSVDEIIADTKSRVDYDMHQLRTEMESIILNLYYLLIWLLIIADILFLFVVIKSFSYVFARVLFSEDQQNFITLQSGSTVMNNGTIRKTGGKYTIPATSQTNFLASRKFEPSGRAPKISIPQWTKGFLARLRHGTWSMNEIVMESDRSAVKFNAPGGKEFVEWELADGEVVIFSYRHFVAMSETIQLSTIVSLRFSTLLLGKIFFTAATGPGKLILSSKGSPTPGNSPADLGSIPESRLLAWQQNTRFAVESELNVFDVLFSGVYLKKQGTDLVIIDSDQKGKAQSGIKKFFLHFLLPV